MLLNEFVVTLPDSQRGQLSHFPFRLAYSMISVFQKRTNRLENWMLISDFVLGLCVAIWNVGCEVVIKHVYSMDHREFCVLACPDGMIGVINDWSLS